jgi:GntR family transcriptional regulator
MQANQSNIFWQGGFSEILLDEHWLASIHCTMTTNTVGKLMAQFQINITTGAGTPIYRQIVDQVRLAAATGTLSAGDSLPSVRSMAERLLINSNTVAKAYSELVREGVLESHQGLGVFVAPKRQIYSKVERLRRLRGALDNFVHEAVFLDFTADEIREAMDEKLAELDWGAKPAGAEK